MSITEENWQNMSIFIVNKTLNSLPLNQFSRKIFFTLLSQHTFCFS